MNTVKPVLETICIKRPPALRDHCSDTTTTFITSLEWSLNAFHTVLLNIYEFSTWQMFMLPSDPVGLTHYQTTKFKTGPNCKSLQTTISSLMKMAESFPKG